VRQGACRLASAWLDAAAQAVPRLDDPDDAEALHDFRVALRRLRSTLRAYRPWTGDAVPAKLRQRLRRLARETNAARDAEVQLEWLNGSGFRLAPRERAGFEWFRAHLAARRDEAYARIRADAVASFDDIERKLRARIAACEADAAGGSEHFGHVAGRLIGEHSETLAQALARIGSLEDEKAIHAARIAGKRLRYLIEPVAPLTPAGPALVKAMKAFQDRFGALCDLFVAARELSEAVEVLGRARPRPDRRRASLSGKRADPMPGLMALTERVRRRTHRLYAEVCRRYLGKRVATLLKPIERLGERLAERPRVTTIES